MAWTVTKYPTVFGNKRVVGIKCVADAATQAVETGLKYIEWMGVGYSSMTTIVGLNVAINSNASGVAALGTVGCSGFTSGDVFYITVYGR